jgi:hypothetical protein
MTVDEIIVKLPERGPVTVNGVAAEIAERFLHRVRMKLESCGCGGLSPRGQRGRSYTCRLLRLDRGARALCEKGGGLSRTEKTARWGCGKRELVLYLSIRRIAGRGI